MRRPSLTCVCLVLLLSSSQAIADLSPRSDRCSVRISPDSAAVSSAFSGYVSASDIRFCFWGSLGQCGLPGASDGRCLIKRAAPPGPSVQNTGLGESIAAHEAGAVLTWEVPPPPGSASLALTGLLGVAGAQILRSSRQLHLGVLSDWQQVARVSDVGDMSLSSSRLASRMVFDGTRVQREQQRVSLLLLARCPGQSTFLLATSQRIPAILSPRAPPA